MMSRLSVMLFVLMLFITCANEPVIVPKPRIYPKIEFPAKNYIPFISPSCPFEMEIPSYFEFVKDSSSFEIKPNSFCWFDLRCESLNASYHLSYLPIESRASYDELVSDAFELVDKHNVKANYRRERLVSLSNKNLYGLIFEIDGPVASPFQFYLTDSTHHFLRGSLYFKTKVNQDSLAPALLFIKNDFEHMLETFSWK